MDEIDLELADSVLAGPEPRSVKKRRAESNLHISLVVAGAVLPYSNCSVSHKSYQEIKNTRVEAETLEDFQNKMFAGFGS